MVETTRQFLKVVQTPRQSTFYGTMYKLLSIINNTRMVAN